MPSPHKGDADLQPAGYGKACTACAESKAKCVFRSNSASCLKCERANRDCQPCVTGPRRARKRKTPDSGHEDAGQHRIARLEGKLDGLVSVICAGIESGTVALDASTKEKLMNLVDDDDTEEGVTLTPASNLSIREPSIVAPDGPAVFGPHEIISPESAEAQSILDTFRESAITQLPFVRLPKSSVELYSQRPYLWLCCMGAGTKVTRHKTSIGQQMKEVISREALLKSDRTRERTFDLLLGHLVHITWAGHFGSKIMISVLTQVAIMLVFEMGLNRPIYSDTNPFACKWKQPYGIPVHGPRTMEERRAVLGVFMVTSHLSYHLTRTDSLRWTAHMSECLELLSTQPEYEGDEVLARLVRMQLVTEKMALSAWYHSTVSNQAKPSPLSQLYTINAELAGIWSTFSAEVKADNLMRTYHAATQLYINESALIEMLNTTNPINLEQFNHLNACVRSAKAYLAVMCDLPLHIFPFLTTFVFGISMKSLNMLLKIGAFDNAGWNRLDALAEIDGLNTLDKFTALMENGSAAAGLDDTGATEPNMLDMMAKNLVHCKTTYVNALTANGLPTPAATDDGLSMNDPVLWDFDINGDFWMTMQDMQGAFVDS